MITDEDDQPTRRVTVTIVLDVNDDFELVDQIETESLISDILYESPGVLFFDIKLEGGPIV